MHEDDLADPLGVLLEENLEGMQLLGYTLNVVESVDTDDDLDAFKAFFELLDARDDFLAFESL